MMWCKMLNASERDARPLVEVARWVEYDSNSAPSAAVLVRHANADKLLYDGRIYCVMGRIGCCCFSISLDEFQKSEACMFVNYIDIVLVNALFSSQCSLAQLGQRKTLCVQ